jgi:hypothetical protein
MTWRTRPINPVCEVLVERGTFCGERTAFAYPAARFGWMALCDAHGQKHRPHCSTLAELLEAGEQLAEYEPGANPDWQKIAAARAKREK